MLNHETRQVMVAAIGSRGLAGLAGSVNSGTPSWAEDPGEAGRAAAQDRILPMKELRALAQLLQVDATVSDGVGAAVRAAVRAGAGQVVFEVGDLESALRAGR